MKKITLFILTIFTVATLYAAARPSLDGRAVVADSGTMPRGLFARTVGYLPGDSVTVTNPATGSTVDVLILGAIDPSEGVAILLSPESAEALRIKPESNVQVKLTKRAGSLDENANGSAVLSDIEEEKEIPAVAENTVEETTDEVIEEIPAVAENAAVEPVEEIPVVPETPVASAKPVETIFEEVPPVQTADVPLEKVVPVPVVAAVAEGEDLQKVVLVEPENEEPAKPVEEVVPEVVEEVASEVVVAEEKVSAEPEEELQQVIIVETEKTVEPEKANLQPVIEELPVYVEAEPAVIEGEPEVEVAYSEGTPYSEEEIDAYQPIVLVPTESNPPVAEEAPAPAEETVVAVAEPAPVVEAPSVEKPVVTNNWNNYVVPSLKNLRSGCYYVQVASLGKEENIKGFVDKYSDKYPLVLVQNSAKTSYQVMVGPLNIDEYGSVGEKFKAYGFKDSFVRKIR